MTSQIRCRLGELEFSAKQATEAGVLPCRFDTTRAPPYAAGDWILSREWPSEGVVETIIKAADFERLCKVI